MSLHSVCFPFLFSSHFTRWVIAAEPNWAKLDGITIKSGQNHSWCTMTASWRWWNRSCGGLRSFLFFDHFLRSQRGQDNKYMEETVWRLESGSTFQQLASHHQQGQNAACLLFHWRRSSWYQYKLLWIMESIRIYKKSENLFDKLLNCYRHGCISLAGSISSLSHKSFISRRPIKPLQKHCVIKRPLWRCS